MRPGEIFALKRANVEKGYADIKQRIYRGQTDTPKTFKSTRWAAMGDWLEPCLQEWLSLLPDTRPEAWVFPSERLKTAVSKDNCWRRSFLPKLQPVQLEWANFQVMRRTHSTLMAEVGVDPQVRADQMGQSVDVNQNEYTQSSLARRKDGVNELTRALRLM
jgi:integrase